MPSKIQYSITDAVNDMIACDQIRQEITGSSIAPSLVADPNGVMCTKVYVFFEFDADLDPGEVSTLDAIVAAHTGEGLVSANSLEDVSVTGLPTTGLTPGSTLYATDGNEGPAPVWFDGTDWRWYASNGIVSP